MGTGKGVGGRFAERDAVQRWVARLYDRHGARGLTIRCLAIDMAIVIGSLLGTAIWCGRYLRFSATDYAASVGIGLPIACAITLAGVFWRHQRYTAVIRWVDGDREADAAPVVWMLTIGIPADLARRGAVIILGAAAPILVPFEIVRDKSLSSILAIFVAGLVGAAAGLILVVYAASVAIRPVLEDIADQLPVDFDPALDGWSIGAKILAPLPAVVLVCAVSVGAFVDLTARGPWRFMLAVAIALLTAVVAGSIFWTVSRSYLNPLDELLAATRRVQSGDLSTPVPIVTDDELGTVAHGFNQMLATLARHERELLQHQEELRESRARVVAAADAARRRVERDLHDGAQQQLVLIGLRLGAARRLVTTDPERAAIALAELQTDVTGALEALRHLAHGIYPAVLENEGVAAALAEAAKRAAIPATVVCNRPGRYPADVEAAVYFCCLEALQNASKYAGDGSRAAIEVSEAAGTLTFVVSDDGAGFDATATNGSSGFASMTDRVGALGGQLRVTSEPGRGTTVTGTVPLS